MVAVTENFPGKRPSASATAEVIAFPGNHNVGSNAEHMTSELIDQCNSALQRLVARGIIAPEDAAASERGIIDGDTDVHALLAIDRAWLTEEVRASEPTLNLLVSVGLITEEGAEVIRERIMMGKISCAELVLIESRAQFVFKHRDVLGSWTANMITDALFENSPLPLDRNWASFKLAFAKFLLKCKSAGVKMDGMIDNFTDKLRIRGELSSRMNDVIDPDMRPAA